MLERKELRAKRHYCPIPFISKFQNRYNHFIIEFLLIIFTFEFWFLITLVAEGFYIFFKCIYFVKFDEIHKLAIERNEELPYHKRLMKHEMEK